jgi:protein TonB
VVKEAVVVRRVEPVYPDLARRARISGEVQLEGVIGTDGRIRELKVLSGHPLLTKAALDAVSQWLYRPTTLNGEAVEVIAPITVTFRLN